MPKEDEQNQIDTPEEGTAWSPLTVLPPSLSDLGTRLGRVLDLFPDRKSAAQAAGRSEDMLAAYVKGRNAPPFDALARLAAASGVSLDWLAFGVGDDPRQGFDQGAIHRKVASLARSPWAGFVLVPRYDVRAGAGQAQFAVDEGVSDFLAFREDWVRFRLRRNPANLVVIEAVGDSMEPTIENGDIILMDKSETRIRDSAIYVLASGDEVIVKRVERKFDGSVTIISDNPRYEKVTLTAAQVPDLRVLGRIVWAGGLV